MKELAVLPTGPAYRPGHRPGLQHRLQPVPAGEWDRPQPSGHAALGCCQPPAQRRPGPLLQQPELQGGEQGLGPRPGKPSTPPPKPGSAPALQSALARPRPRGPAPSETRPRGPAPRSVSRRGLERPWASPWLSPVGAHCCPPLSSPTCFTGALPSAPGPSASGTVSPPSTGPAWWGCPWPPARPPCV